jgi:hypothetical protein
VDSPEGVQAVGLDLSDGVVLQVEDLKAVEALQETGLENNAVLV